MYAPWIIYIHVKPDGQLALQRKAAISVYFILSGDDSMACRFYFYLEPSKTRQVVSAHAYSI